MRATTHRQAFTFAEFLIVLAIFAILLGLLLPAVQKVREASTRMQSSNNMKMLGLGVHNYHDVHGNMPQGIDALGFSATAKLLPYIEQDNLYRLIDFKKAPTDEANRQVRQVSVKMFLNPQDAQTFVKEGIGANNYLFCAGTKAALKDNDGAFFDGPGQKIAHFVDGTSNTIMTGETFKGDGGKMAQDVLRQMVELSADALTGLAEDAGVDDFKNNKNISGDRCSTWMDGAFLQTTFNSGRAINDERPDVVCAGKGGWSALRGNRSQAINVGFVDGSVRSIRNTVPTGTWKALCTRGGGEVVQIDF